MTEGPATLTIEPGEYLGKPRLELLLAGLAPAVDGASSDTSSSLYLRPGEAPAFVSRSSGIGRRAGDQAGWAAQLSLIGRAVLDSDTGVVGLRAGSQGLIIIPPFPVLAGQLLPHWDATPLLQLLAAEYTIGVVLLRLGRFSVAVYHGEKLVSSKTDARFVKGRNRAGGSSQRRFERIREGQMRRIYDKACLAVRAQFEPHARQIDYVFLGGERLTLNGFLKVCPHMVQFRERTLARLLNIRDPKRDTLEAVGQMLGQCRVYPVQW